MVGANAYLLVLLVIVGVVNGVTNPPTTAPPTTEPPTTTAEPTTVTTTSPPTTTPVPTTSDAPTTTGSPTTTTDATTTTQPTTYCNLQAPYGTAEGDSAYNGADDGCVGPLTVDYDIPFFNKDFRDMYVCTNGIMCFGTPHTGYAIPVNGRSSRNLARANCVAPYFADLVSDTGGTVWYQIYDVATNPTLASDTVVTTTETLVHNEYDVTFTAKLVVKVTWDLLSQYEQDPADTVLFQMLFASDGSDSYVFYHYEPNGMNLVDSMQFIGLIKNGLAIGYTDSLDGSYLRTPDAINFNHGSCYGATSFQLFNPAVRRRQRPNYRIECINWHSSELRNINTYTAAMSNMPICACSALLMSWDPFYSTTWDITASTITVSLLASRAFPQHSKTCAYTSAGNFIGSGPSVGTFTLYNPITASRNYKAVDAYYKNVCCEKAGMCDKFYEVRPRSTQCYTFQQLFFAMLFGDPHVTSLDGLTYTFNGLGEYVMMQTPAAAFEMQARTGQAVFISTGQPTDATIYTAFVVNTDNGWIQIEINNTRGGINVLVGESRTNFTDYTLDFDASTYYLTTLGLEIQKLNKTIVTKFVDHGVSLTVTIGTDLLFMRLAMFSTAVTTFQGTTEGLLGNFNGDNTDDFIPRGETTSLTNPSEQQIFELFGQTWITTEAESIFAYADSKSHADFQNISFTPQYLDQADPVLVAEAMTRCEADDLACIFDYVFTGSATVAQETADVQGNLLRDQQLAANQVPSITLTSGNDTVGGINYVYLNVNETKVVSLGSVDDGSVVFELSNTTVGIATLVDNLDGTAAITIIIPNLDPVSVGVIITDNMNVMSPLLVLIPVLCDGCTGGQGTCNFTSFREIQNDLTSFSKVAVCECGIAWQGNDCETDVDGCLEGPCMSSQVCTDTVAADQVADPSLPAYTCTDCSVGFTRIGDKCADINECLDTATYCVNGICTNTFGSYYCTCNAGYRLDANLTTCSDINECDDSTSDCQQLCVNTVGGFTCDCLTGYIKSGNSCPIDTPPAPCTVGTPCPNADGCTDDGQGNAVCFCNAGYELNAVTGACDDIDECALGVCSQDCQNSVGSFMCSCITGYTQEADVVTCKQCEFPTFGVDCTSTCDCGGGASHCDPAVGCICLSGWDGVNCATNINECTVNPDICGDINAVCTDNIGSYTCPCRTGFTSDNATCIDIDECADVTLNTCEQVCNNNLGSFSCSCNTGYVVNSVDDTRCADYDECSTGVSECSQICTNVIGGYNCDCYLGFELMHDRRTCATVEDMCAASTLSCNQICTVVGGVPECKCEHGYKLGTDLQTCLDVDECSDDALNLCTIKNTCLNSNGSYICSCDAGFYLEQDQRSCAECDSFHWGVQCANECNCAVGAAGCDPVTGCVCDAGWDGTVCDVDLDECAQSPCQGVNKVCVNIQGSYMCTCATGMEVDVVSGDCIDVDECQSDTLNDCSQICTNSIGSYECSCHAGFTQDTTNCNDVDECSGQNECQQICTNTIGSYRCSCDADYVLNGNKRACDPLVQCTTTSCATNAECAVLSGVETCTCRTGYAGTDAAVECNNINECTETPGICSQKCVDNFGSYTCECDLDGYLLGADLSTCIECDQGTFGNNCASTCLCETVNDNTNICNTTDGSCVCNSGWEGTTCATNINECISQQNPCPSNSACDDDPLGTFSCICSVGFYKLGNGTCQECPSTKYGVDCTQTCSCVTDNTAVCDKTDGQCTCNSGWEGDNCQLNIDECTVNPDICNDTLKTCVDNDGAYDCDCVAGYTLFNNLQCVDIQECLDGTNNCNYLCVEQAGSFSCECGPGYTGIGNQCTPCVLGSWGDQCQQACDCAANNTVECNQATGCTCEPGWQGTTCSEDVNECTLNTHNCTSNSTCSNNDGEFTCPCDIGFVLDNGQCVECSNNSHGGSCAIACDCVADHALVSTQTCNHVTGSCECKVTWTGNTCQTDVDECLQDATICLNKPKQGCHNLEGSYECSCYIGYESDPISGDCVDVTGTTTPISAPNGQVGIPMYVELDLDIDAVSMSHNLTVQSTNQAYTTAVDDALTAYFVSEMGTPDFRAVTVHSVKEDSTGQLIVNYTVLIRDTVDARQEFSKASYKLFQGTNLTMFQQSPTVQNLAVGNNPVLAKDTNENSVKCLAYFEAGATCLEDYECVVVNDSPVCQPVQGSDNLDLVLGLGIGIPLFLLLCLLMCVCCVVCCARRRRRRRRRHYDSSHSDEQDRSSYNAGFFPAIIPTKFNNRHSRLPDPVYIPYNWEGESEVSHSTSPSSHDDNRRPRRHRMVRSDIFPIEEENAGNDPYGKSNFSWDFLYDHLGPNERYEIQRPHLDRY